MVQVRIMTARKVYIYILAFFGILWTIHGTLIFVVNISLTTESDTVNNLKTFAYILSVLSFLNGAAMAYTGFSERERILYRKLSRSLSILIIRAKFELPIMAFAFANSLRHRFARKFIKRRMLQTKGRITLNKSEIISYVWKDEYGRPVHIKKHIKKKKK